MAEGKQDSVVPPPRKRPAPTIELKATEIASDPVTPSQPIDPKADTATAMPQPEAPKAAEAAAASGPPRPASPPKDERVAGVRAAAAERFSSFFASSSPSSFSWPLLGAGAAGAAAMLCLFALLWAAGVLGTREDSAAADNPSSARLAALEQQVRDLAARPQPAALDQRAFADLAARVGAAEQAAGRLAGIEAGLAKLETAVAAPRPADPALAARIAALETALRPLADLPSRVDAIAAAQKNAQPAPAAADQGDVAALTARIAALEQAEKAIEQRVARPAVGGADQAGRIAFVAVALRAAAERGDPFAQELSAAKALAPDAAMLAPLEPYATTGVPRPLVLARELSQVAPAMLNAAGPPQEGGIIERLQQNAERLVRIRPINEGAGDAPGTVVARAEVKAAHGDIAGALAEVARLPDAVRAPAQGWIRKAEMQVAALAAARRFAETTVDALRAGQ
jgi:hypothetical protein